jgi:hypothetical protein
MQFWIFNNPVREQALRKRNVPRVWRFAAGETAAPQAPLASEARRQTRVSHRDRDKSAGFGFGSVANLQM